MGTRLFTWPLRTGFVLALATLLVARGPVSDSSGGASSRSFMDASAGAVAVFKAQ